MTKLEWLEMAKTWLQRPAQVDRAIKCINEAIELIKIQEISQ